MSKAIKFYVLLAIGVSAFFIAIWAVSVGPLYIDEVSKFKGSSRVLVTAAHLGDIAGYTCVYSDDATDIGIYLKDGYVATAPPVGARVEWMNYYGTVEQVYDGEFLIKPHDTEMVYPGLSGTPVTYRYKQIGYISGWNGDGLVRCIFY